MTTIAGYGSAVQQTTTLGYDAAGNTITSTDALNKTTTMTFDALNRQISRANATRPVQIT